MNERISNAIREIGSELEQIGSELEHSYDNAEECRETSEILESVAVFARYVSRAKECRLAGNIQDALVYERHADSIYKALPEACKW